MVKTTLPSQGSHFITIQSEDAVLAQFAAQQGNTYLLRTGGFTESDLGQRCFHAKTGGVELVLNHLVDQPQETVLVDMTAGADAFASGLFSRFDLTLIVVEPTLKSVSVYEQYKAYAKDYGIAIRVIGNKVENDDDIAFIQEKCGTDLIGCLTHSQWVKRSERGQEVNIADLEPNNAELLTVIMETATQYPRNWEKYWQWGIHFHNLNAEGWANDAMGCDVRAQIDPGFLQSFRPETVLDRAD